MGKPKNDENIKNERIVLFFALLNLAWLFRNINLLNGNTYISFLNSLTKNKWILIIEVILALIGLILAMELRNGKIKLINGIIFCGLIIISGLLIDFY